MRAPYLGIGHRLGTLSPLHVSNFADGSKKTPKGRSGAERLLTKRIASVQPGPAYPIASCAEVSPPRRRCFMVVQFNLCRKTVWTPCHAFCTADIRKKQSHLSASAVRRGKDASLEAWRQMINPDPTVATSSKGKREHSVAAAVVARTRSMVRI